MRCIETANKNLWLCSLNDFVEILFVGHKIWDNNCLVYGSAAGAYVALIGALYVACVCTKRRCAVEKCLDHNYEIFFAEIVKVKPKNNQKIILWQLNEQLKPMKWV